MAVRRGWARFAMVLTLAAGLVAVGATPAAAAEDNVGIRLPTKFTAGGSPGPVTVSVAKRTQGCVAVRTALGMRLAGLPAEQVRVEVHTGDEWRSIGVTAVGDGLVVTERTVPDKAVICKRRSTYVRYRVTFLDGAPSGQVTIVGEAYSAGGGLIDRAADTRRVVGGTGSSPSPSVTGSPAAVQEPPAASPSVELAAPSGRPATPSGSGFGLSTLLMLFGLVLVGLGGVLLVLLLRRHRADPDEPGNYAFPDPGPPPPLPPAPYVGDRDSTLIMPKARY